MFLRVLVVIRLVLLHAFAQDGRDNTTEPLSTYVSRPDLRAPALNVSIQDGYASGYFFICPYRATQTGPYIFDKAGNLVWSGYNATEAEQAEEINTHAMRICSFHGSDHLCMWKGTQDGGSGLGHSIILNQNYELVGTFGTGNNAPQNDFHESHIIEGGTALLTAYNPIQYDLAAYNVTSSPSWLIEGMFQEVNVTSGEVLFEWHSIDHVDPSASYVLPSGSEVAGNGTTAEAGWDYFHINAIDKGSDGSYLISSRHTSAVYHINASDGSVIWKLSYGSPNNTFHFNDNFNFTFQHHARFHSENDTHTVISIFDNASNDYNKTAIQSSGMVIALDLNEKMATLVNRTFAPKSGGILAGSQADYQLLDDGGTFMGWGSVPAVSETNAAGEPVFYATFGSYVYNYRAYSYNWTGRPLDKPALATPAQSQNASTPLVAYFSWNGATEVTQWRLWGSVNKDTGFQELDTVDKQGFETRWTSANYTPFVFVEALGGERESLGNSTPVGVGRLASNGTVVMPTSVPVMNDTTTPTSTSTGSPGMGAAAQPSQTAVALGLYEELGHAVRMATMLGGIVAVFVTL